MFRRGCLGPFVPGPLWPGALRSADADGDRGRDRRAVVERRDGVAFADRVPRLPQGHGCLRVAAAASVPQAVPVGGVRRSRSRTRIGEPSLVRRARSARRRRTRRIAKGRRPLRRGVGDVLRRKLEGAHSGLRRRPGPRPGKPPGGPRRDAAAAAGVRGAGLFDTWHHRDPPAAAAADLGVPPLDPVASLGLRNDAGAGGHRASARGAPAAVARRTAAAGPAHLRHDDGPEDPARGEEAARVVRSQKRERHQAAVDRPRHALGLGGTEAVTPREAPRLQAPGRVPPSQGSPRHRRRHRLRRTRQALQPPQVPRIPHLHRHRALRRRLRSQAPAVRHLRRQPVRHHRFPDRR
mmetsp:Transcript_1138/g.3875  ORF Transcript_1138/g.3875 Transcript_1138/m.3875 type:complete len:351 (+) Transcript_1138:508-1560(+)